MYIWRMHNFNIFNRCCYNPMLQFNLFLPMMCYRTNPFMMPVFNYYPQTYYQPMSYLMARNNIFEQCYRRYSGNAYENPNTYTPSDLDTVTVGESVIDIDNGTKIEQNSQQTQQTQQTQKAQQTHQIQQQKIEPEREIVIPKTVRTNSAIINRIKQVAKNLNCNYEDLMAVINSESAFDPQAGYNKKTGKIGPAVGLLQFTKSSVNELNKVYGLNLTKEKILNMSSLEQLDLVEKYLLIAKRYKFSRDAKLSAADLYAITFLPGRANSEILCREGERGSDGKLLNYYESNRGLDINNDKKITKAELAQRVDNKRVNESLFA